MTEVIIQSLTKRFGDVTAVDSISMTIRDGEFVSFLGPSGCGKTTTLRMIAGFEDVSGGSILFDGQDVVNVPAEKRDIGMVFQNYALFPHMTVGQNLAFGLEMRRIARPEIERRVAAVLDMVQLKGFADRYPRQLSGGQQQRVALARALVIEPRILLLDEPLANLDAKLRDEMRLFIRDLHQRVGITTVYVTHDQAEALTMSDRVVVMFGGRIAQMAEPDAIYQRPLGRGVAEFVGQVNMVEGEVTAVGANNCTVRLPFASVTVDKPFAVSAGDRVVLALRPEAIEMIGEGGEQAGWAGTVSSGIYSGSLMDYRVALDGGVTLAVQTFASTRFATGDRVVLNAPQRLFWLTEVIA